MNLTIKQIQNINLSTVKNNIQIFLMFAFVALLILNPETSFAQQGPLPWESFTKLLACSLTGPWIKWAAVIAIAISGVMFGLGELNGPFKTALQIAGGFSIAIAAAAVVGWMLPSGPGITSC